jgi:hypothetical protein
MADSNGFDPCECVPTHAAVMRRLMNMVKHQSIDKNY